MQVAEPGAARCRRSGSGTRWRPSNRSATACCAPRSLAPGRPGGRRRSGRARAAGTDATTPALVEPMSVTVAPSGRGQDLGDRGGQLARPARTRPPGRRPATASRRSSCAGGQQPRSSAAAPRGRVGVVARGRPRRRPARARPGRASRPSARGRRRRAIVTLNATGEGLAGHGEVRLDLAHEGGELALEGSAGRRRRARARGSGGSPRSGRRRRRRRPRGRSGATSCRLPAACDGSTITGRCVSALSTGIAPMSSVKRVERSNVRIPRSHRMIRSLPSLATYSAAIRSSSTVADIPRLSMTGLSIFPISDEQVEVLHVARADPDEVDVLVRPPRGRARP